MSEFEALELLKHHSYTHDDIKHPKTSKGFLGMLRPFDGELYEENFHELMTILKILKGYFRAEKIDRQIIAAFWGICHFAQRWALDEGGMLRRNNLLGGRQISQISVWTECISYAVAGLLEGVGDDQAFELYRLYLKSDKE